jgi:hypothetical protein
MAFDTQPDSPWSSDGYSFVSVRPNSTNVPVTLNSVNWYPGKYSQAQTSDGVYVQADARATFALDSIAFDPKPRDTITPPGDRPHVILSVVKAPYMKFWKVTARDLLLAYDLRSSGTIQRATVTPGADALRNASYSTLEANVPIRIQVQSTDAEKETDGGFTTRTIAKAFMDTSTILKAGDLIVVSGVSWTVLSESGVNYDSLTIADVSRTE